MQQHMALYRKYRPRTFSEVVGQKAVVESLKNQVASGKLGHAFLFTGTRGTGKTSCAKIFAKAINCTNSTNG
ncbi:MAG: DNA polymerase III subunit gamma/tau, partial [Oscillospiraceae bacterium]